MVRITKEELQSRAEKAERENHLFKIYLHERENGNVPYASTREAFGPEGEEESVEMDLYRPTNASGGFVVYRFRLSDGKLSSSGIEYLDTLQSHWSASGSYSESSQAIRLCVSRLALERNRAFEALREVKAA